MGKTTLGELQPAYGVVLEPIVQPAYGVQLDPIVQPAYGVQLDPVVQPAYGVELDPIVQPAYGVELQPIVQPAYGIPFPGPDIDLSYEQLEENINMLKSSISTLKDSWNNETKTNIQKLENSWAGKDCTEYTRKLSKMDQSVQNTISALELLCSTYEQARDMISENQAAVVTAIQDI